MNFALGSDHRGYELKRRLAQRLQKQGHQVTDVGTNTPDSTDYADFAAVVAERVSCGQSDRGILICGTGIGMAIAANKFPKVRASTALDVATATICRQHNDVNVLCLPGSLVDDPDCDLIIDAWIETPFEGGRHARRLGKIRQIENRVRATDCPESADD